MKVEEVMSHEPAYCTPSTSLEEVACMMIECDCGEIPVVDSESGRKPMGVVTDRDIVCRTLAKGLNPLTMKARDCMSEPCVTVTPDMSIEECCKVLEDNHIRRVPVVNGDGVLCGIVSVADVALRARSKITAEVIKEVSEPIGVASTVVH
ncbi:MAG: CBS domain-containing protein [Candidatus Binatia bacterium]